MSYQLQIQETTPDGIKRIAREQTDKALQQLREPGNDWEEAIHDVRKRFKKIRAVLRLIRDEIGEKRYRSENMCFRDAGRELSEIRDSTVMIETLDELAKPVDDLGILDSFARVRSNLVDSRQNMTQSILQDEDVIVKTAAIIETARSRIDCWEIVHHDFSAVDGGLKRVYKRGRKAMKKVYKSPTAETFHEWRKCVKYLWYHIRILCPMWPDVLYGLADALHRLSNYLGNDHDLAALRYTLLEYPELCENKKAEEALLRLIQQRQAELQAAVHPLGGQIYAEAPKAFAKRLSVYWKYWCE